MAAELIVPTKLDAEAVARSFFLENPGLSIDDVARALSKAGKGLSKDSISGIRMEVRRQIEASHNNTNRTQQPFIRRKNPFDPKVQIINPVPKAVQHPPFNPPRLATPLAPEPIAAVVPRVLTQKVTEVGPMPVTAPPVQAATPVLPEKDPDVFREEKQKWLADWLLEHPGASNGKARAALREQFGSTLNSDYIREQVSMVQEVAGIQKKAKPVVADHPSAVLAPQGMEIREVADLVHAMKLLGVKKIELKNRFSYVIDLIEKERS